MKYLISLVAFSLFLVASTFDQAVESILLFDQATLEKTVITQEQANAKNQNGKTLIMLCAYKGNTEALTYLIKRGGDINISDNDGRTPLMLSIWSDFDEISFLLLDHQAAINAKSKDGTTPLRLARLKNNKKLIDELLKRGAKE